MITVVAAIIESDRKLLVCQRSKHAAFALKWEFPGGKVKQGESPQAALARELREELGAHAVIGAEVYRTRHKYAEMNNELELIFFEVKIDPAEIRNLVFEQILWAAPRELPALDFLAADRDLIIRLASQSAEAH